jgi:uncharacterized protein YbjT (DUF2867 family)
MKVILIGATGMVGQGCLRECLRDPGVESVLAVGAARADNRTPSCAKSCTMISWIIRPSNCNWQYPIK